MSILAFIVGSAAGAVMRRVGSVLALAFTVALVVVACNGGEALRQAVAPDEHERTDCQRAIVSKVVDGDTVDVDCLAGQREHERVRMLGVNTPEVYGERQCYGPEASAETKRLLQPGQKVSLRFESELRDNTQSHRLLAHIVVHSTVVGQRLVAQGFARAYPPGHRYASERYADRFYRAEQTAKAQHRGLWGACPR